MHLNEEIVTAVFQYKMKMCEFMARDVILSDFLANVDAAPACRSWVSAEFALVEAAAATVYISRFIPPISPIPLFFLSMAKTQ